MGDPVSPLRVALVADPDAPLVAEALTPAAALAYELAAALAEHVHGAGDLVVDLFAARGSACGLPLVSLDPAELPAVVAEPLARHARREALLTQLVLSGMLEGYTVVHCLAPVVTPMQVLAATGALLVQTLVEGPAHPSTQLPPRLVNAARLRRVAVVAAPPVVELSKLLAEGASPRDRTDDEDPMSLAANTVPESLAVGIDLDRYRPAAVAPEQHLAWWGSGGATGEALAREVARRVGLPLRTPAEGESPELLAHARALLHLDPHPTPCAAVWPLRALACGTPTVALAGGGLEALYEERVGEPIAVAGTLVPGAGTKALTIEALASAVESLPSRAELLPLRRRRALGLHNRRAMAARYREIYSELVHGRR